MLQPTWNPIALPGARLTGGRSGRRVNRRSAEAAPNKEGWVSAAPFSVAAAWIAATGASCLFWSITGHREPLDWCRSGGVLTAAAALAALAALVASLVNGVPEGPFRVVSGKRGGSLHPAVQGPPPAWLDAMDRAVTDH